MSTLNDRVDAIHVTLLSENADYADLLRAVIRAEAVEGSLSCDDQLAAKMIRDKAMEIGEREVAGEKLRAIVKALRVVLRRYGMSRKERCEHARSAAP